MTLRYGLLPVLLAGCAFGHSGYIPGYLSWVRHYADSGIPMAPQTNASDEQRLPDDPFVLVDEIAADLARTCQRR